MSNDDPISEPTEPSEDTMGAAQEEETAVAEPRVEESPAENIGDEVKGEVA
jgi:hypothetical protein